MPPSRLKALLLLSECRGEEIWSLEHCRQRGVPAEWIESLSDCFESGFDRDSNTIYIGDAVVNQYYGVRAVDLAVRIGEFLGVDRQLLAAPAASRSHKVQVIREAVEEE